MGFQISLDVEIFPPAIDHFPAHGCIFTVRATILESDRAAKPRAAPLVIIEMSFCCHHALSSQGRETS
jgi:hypothetical protein